MMLTKYFQYIVHLIQDVRSLQILSFKVSRYLIVNEFNNGAHYDNDTIDT